MSAKKRKQKSKLKFLYTWGSLPVSQLVDISLNFLLLLFLQKEYKTDPSPWF